MIPSRKKDIECLHIHDLQIKKSVAGDVRKNSALQVTTVDSQGATLSWVGLTQPDQLITLDCAVKQMLTTIDETDVQTAKTIAAQTNNDIGTISDLVKPIKNDVFTQLQVLDKCVRMKKNELSAIAARGNVIDYTSTAMTLLADEITRINPKFITIDSFHDSQNKLYKKLKREIAEYETDELVTVNVAPNTNVFVFDLSIYKNLCISIGQNKDGGPFTLIFSEPYLRFGSGFILVNLQTTCSEFVIHNTAPISTFNKKGIIRIDYLIVRNKLIIDRISDFTRRD